MRSLVFLVFGLNYVAMCVEALVFLAKSISFGLSL